MSMFVEKILIPFFVFVSCQLCQLIEKYDKSN